MSCSSSFNIDGISGLWRSAGWVAASGVTSGGTWPLRRGGRDAVRFRHVEHMTDTLDQEGLG